MSETTTTLGEFNYKMGKDINGRDESKLEKDGK